MAQSPVLLPPEMQEQLALTPSAVHLLGVEEAKVVATLAQAEAQHLQRPLLVAPPGAPHGYFNQGANTGLVEMPFLLSLDIQATEDPATVGVFHDLLKELMEEEAVTDTAGPVVTTYAHGLPHPADSNGQAGHSQPQLPLHQAPYVVASAHQQQPVVVNSNGMLAGWLGGAQSFPDGHTVTPQPYAPYGVPDFRPGGSHAAPALPARGSVVGATGGAFASPPAAPAGNGAHYPLTVVHATPPQHAALGVTPPDAAAGVKCKRGSDGHKHSVGTVCERHSHTPSASECSRQAGGATGPAAGSASGGPSGGGAGVGGGEGSGGTSKATAAGKCADPVVRRAAVQKRYREKKNAALSSLQAEAEQQLATLKMLEREHEALASKQSALEKLVQCRDEQLVVLAKARSMCKLPLNVAPFGSCSATVAGGCFGTDCVSPEPFSSPEELARFKSMDVNDLRALWVGFVTQASKLLAQAAMVPSKGVATGKTAELLDDLVQRTGLNMKRVLQLNCPILTQLMLLNLETGAPTMPPESHWASVLGLLELSEEQTREAVSMVELFVQLMGKVHEERRLLKAELNVRTTASASPTPRPSATGESPALGLAVPPPLTSRSVASGAHGTGGLPATDRLGVEGEMGCAEQLYLNMHKERSTRCLFTSHFFGRLLTSFQLARASVASYPHFPDPLALSRVIAEQSGSLYAKLL